MESNILYAISLKCATGADKGCAVLEYFGIHSHETGDDINYILDGNGKAISNGKEEILCSGTCHICKKRFGVFYNMVLFWLEGGTVEYPDAMAHELKLIKNLCQLQVSILQIFSLCILLNYHKSVNID